MRVLRLFLPSSMRGNLHPKVNERSRKPGRDQRALRVGRHNIVETVQPLGERLYVTAKLGIAALRELGPDNGASWRIKVANKIIDYGLELQLVEKAKSHLIVRRLRETRGRQHKDDVDPMLLRIGRLSFAVALDQLEKSRLSDGRHVYIYNAGNERLERGCFGSPDTLPNLNANED